MLVYVIKRNISIENGTILGHLEYILGRILTEYSEHRCYTRTGLLNN